jgi:hypothetical protein
VRKISDARLRMAEARAPKPHEPLVIHHVIVDVNPIPGGPPVERGVIERTRLIPGGSIDEHWPEPHAGASRYTDPPRD